MTDSLIGQYRALIIGDRFRMAVEALQRRRREKQSVEG